VTVIGLKSFSLNLSILSILVTALTANAQGAPRTFGFMESALEGIGIWCCLVEEKNCSIDIERRLVTKIDDFDNQLYTAIKGDLVLIREFGSNPNFPCRYYKACLDDCRLPLAYQSDEHKAETEKSEIAERTRAALEEIERQIVLEQQALRALNEKS
jgi:hypothetical protein